MIHQIAEIWRQTRDLPPTHLDIVNQLFSEIEHLAQKTPTPENSPEQQELDLRYNAKQSKYYEPRWFSSNGQVQ